MKDLFKGKTSKEIREMLEANCWDHQIMDVDVPLTQTELNQAKESLAEASARKFNIDKEKARVLSKFNEDLKPLKKAVTLNSELLATGLRKTESTVYLMDDQEEGTMNLFLEDGTYLSSRRLTREERQLKIKSRTA